jgi:glycosyltransferase involved in cell wall biosynthesis
MNILLLAYYYPPLNNAGTVRPLQMARWLKSFGHDVFIVTHGDRAATDDRGPSVIRIHDPAFTRCRRGWRFFPWLFWRGWAELQNACGRYASVFSPWRRAVLRRAEEIRKMSTPDLILATYPPAEVLDIGLELARRFKVPLVSDFRDGLLFRSIEEKRLAAHRCLGREYRRLEETAAAQSKMIVVVTPVLQEYFRRTYPGCRSVTVFNGYDEDEWRDLPAAALEPGFFHIVHTGRFTLSDSAADGAPFFDALRRAGRERPGALPFRLHLAGEYSRRELSMLKEWTRSGLARIHPLVSRRESLALQQAADLLFLVTRPGVRSGIPLKLFEYMRSGRPVLSVTDDAEVRRLTEESGSGWSVSPQDRTRMADLLGRILSDPGFVVSLRRDADFIAAYSWPRQMRRLHDLLAAQGGSAG